MLGVVLIIIGIVAALGYLFLVVWSLTLHIGEWRIQRIIKPQTILGFSFSDLILYGSSFVLAIAVLSSNWLALQTIKVNENSYIEFQLKTRPYLTVENLEGNTDLTTTKSEFRLFIKNTGNMPARIISQLMDCPSGSTQSPVLKNDIVGANQSIVYPFSFQGIKELTCTFDIKYRSAIEVLPQSDYETQQKLFYKLGSQMSSGGGFMK